MVVEKEQGQDLTLSIPSPAVTPEMLDPQSLAALMIGTLLKREPTATATEGLPRLDTKLAMLAVILATSLDISSAMVSVRADGSPKTNKSQQGFVT